MLAVGHRRQRGQGDQADGRATRCCSGARRRRTRGSQRFCMGAAWRNPKDRDMPAIVEMVEGVRAMGLETCMTLGMLTPRPGASGSPRRGSITTITISTPRPSIMATSSPRARFERPARHAGAMCARRGSTCAAAGSSAWARRARTASASSTRSPRCRGIPKACRSTRWCRSRARCWATCSPTRRWRRSTTSSSSAPSRWRGSRCR